MLPIPIRFFSLFLQSEFHVPHKVDTILDTSETSALDDDDGSCKKTALTARLQHYYRELFPQLVHKFWHSTVQCSAIIQIELSRAQAAQRP